MSKINVNTPKYWRLPVQNGDDQQEVKKVENTPRKPEPADWGKEIDRLFNKFGKENVKKVKDKIISFDPGAEEGDKAGFITYDDEGNPHGVYHDFSKDEQSKDVKKLLEQKKAEFEKEIDEYLNNSPYTGYDWVRKELEDIKNTKVSEDQKKRFFEILDRIEEAERKNHQKYEKGWHEDIVNWDDVVNNNATPVYRTDVELLNKIREMRKHPGERPLSIPSITTAWDFDQIANKICQLHAKKNADYGDAAYESYKDFGLVSYVIRLGDKFRRLKTLTSPGYEQQIKTESIEDTLMDLAAYSIMAIEALHKK